MRNEGLGSWPERRLRMGPEREALVFEGTRTTYRELALRCRRTAHALRSLGVGPGDRVAYVGFNHPTYLDVLFGCGLLGAVFVPVNARLAPAEVAHVLDDSGATVVLHGPERAPVRDGRRWLGCESAAWTELVAASADTLLDEVVAPTDTCLVMYTSGTTGHPKGAVLTHANMTYNALNQILGQDVTSAERTLAVSPLFHIGGLGGSVTPTLMCGGAVVLHRGFDAGAVLAAIEAERITSFFGVPTVVDLLLRHPAFGTTDLGTLRTISVAGAPLPELFIGPWLERDVAIQQAYGMTESAPSATILGTEDVRRKLGSAGRMCFFTDVRVVDPDGVETAPGELGEVVISGPNVMAGYWNRPEATAETLRDGWLHTGDAAVVDDEGYLYVRDRFKDLYISGGENVYPAEVESALLQLPGVLEAAVLGVPDARWGESGVAFVVPRPGHPTDAAALLTELRTHLAGFKLPREVVFLEALPHTGSGKVRKTELRHLVVAAPPQSNGE